MLRDVFYYGTKPNVHPREKFAKDFQDAQRQATTEHFWIVNEYCDYTNFDWDFDFEFLSDDLVWTGEHINVWPSLYQKDSGTWLCNKKSGQVIVYRNDVDKLKRKNIRTSNWVIKGKIDESKFDFAWHPDPTEPPYIYQFPSQWNKTGGPRYHVDGATEVKYVNSQVAFRLADKRNWEINDNINVDSFDFSWHPDDTDPPYIYEFGTQWQKTGGPRYVVPGSTQLKYINIIKGQRLSCMDNWTIPNHVDVSEFDFSWHPDDTEPAFIYEFGTQHQKTGGPVYTMPGATERKYVSSQKAKALPQPKKFRVQNNYKIKDFDYSWHPDSTEEAFVYVFGNQHHSAEKMPTIHYRVIGAREEKYINTIHATLDEDKTNWQIPDYIDQSSFDFSWVPDPGEPKDYVYEFATVWNDRGGPRYINPGVVILPNGKPLGTFKYIEDIKAKCNPDMSNWIIPENVDTKEFDFSWRPHPDDPPYVYEFGTQWQKTGGPKYIPEGIVVLKNGKALGEYKYVDVQKAKTLPDPSKFIVPDNVDTSEFDFSWHPDETDLPYIYQFGTQWQKTGGPKYITPGADSTAQVKYVENNKVKRLPSRDNWVIPHKIDVSNFDFSWHPDETDLPYVYEFGTQHQKTGGPKYVVEGGSITKYIDNQKAIALPQPNKFTITEVCKVKDFDYSWHPDSTEDPYIYVFGNQHYSAEKMSTITYSVFGAKEQKYINNIVATLDQDKSRWLIPTDIDDTGFDYSWVPDPGDPKGYVYIFGTQHQKTGGPKYIPDGIVVLKNGKALGEYKYVDTQKVRKLPDPSKFFVPDNVDVTQFDFSWHADETDLPFVYEFGTQHQPNGGPKYTVEGATQTKYVSGFTAIRLPSLENWTIPNNVDITDFDFSWHPDETEPPYIYEFATVWNNRGGPVYTVPGADSKKYIENVKCKTKVDKSHWLIPNHIDDSNFDYSWVPHPDDPPYVYVFGTQWRKTGGPKYVPDGIVVLKNNKALGEYKYVESQKVIKLPEPDKFTIPSNIDTSSFDFSWHPDEIEEPYIYEFGTQWHDVGGPKYVVPNATKMKYVSEIKGTLKPDRTNWEICAPIVEEEFDFTWHPHPDDPPYIYVFGNNQYAAEDMPTVKYVVPGAEQIKYMPKPIAKLAQDKTNWIIPDDVDITGFDFSWKPNPHDPLYVYEFGTQWQKTGGPKYVPPGIVVLKNGKALGEYKYVDSQKVRKLPNRSKFEIPSNIDASTFDFSWHPDDTDLPYIYEFATVWQNNGGPRYVVTGATQVKYVDVIKAQCLPTKEHWDIPDYIDQSSFDFSWHPDTTALPYIYEFATIWSNRGGPRYVVPEATEYKYIEDINKAKTLPDMTNWQIPNYVDRSSFDFSWRPHPDDPKDYVYEFATIWNDRGGPRYISPGVVILPNGKPLGTFKYLDVVKAKTLPDMTYWQLPDTVKKETFDFGWRPHPDAPPYIYEFATVWNDRGGPKYVVPGATEYKYVDDIKAELLPDTTNWQLPNYIDPTDFDFSWRPHPEAPPYIYEFATVWNNRGGPKYVVPGATDYSYVEHIKAKCKPSMENWLITAKLDVSDFDFSWRPHPDSPPYVYQFGTLENDMDGPVYFTPGNTGEIVKLQRVRKAIEAKKEEKVQVVNKYYIETTLQDLIAQHPNEAFWALNPDLDYTNFNFEWRPTLEQERYIHAFGTKNNINTQTYFVPDNEYTQKHQDMNYVDEQIDVKINIDMFFVDKGNPEVSDRFNKLKEKFGDRIQKTRFLNSWVDTINRCINRSTTNLCWILNSELDYSNFDFDFYPDPWQFNMVHVFGTQWSHWGTTYVVNRETFPTDTKYIKVIEHLKNLNFVKDKRARATNNLYDIYVIDHGNIETDVTVARIKAKANGKDVRIVPYENSYLDTIKNIVKGINPKKEHYIWITSSICDYAKFSFDYICDPFAKDNLHVFPSNNQKFGDTFLLDVNKTLEIINDMEILQQYHKINFAGANKTERLPAPVLYSEKDTHVGSLDVEFDFPYVVLQTEDIKATDEEPMCLWAPDTKNIVITSTGATRIIVPKEAKDTIKKEFYDYPYIKTASRLIDSKPLDIVFLSNGEKCAEENYEHLLAVTKGLKNRVVRVDGVNGRVAAYHAAVLSSNTPWAFTVFAKLKINPKFDFNWQPDRLQIPKHYIFHAKNPVNGLEYGHQGMIAYNKRLTLANTGKGLDFTLDDPHETVELLSGTANFNTDPYSTWRTAFREVIKLKSDYTDISQDRLKVWLTKAKGKFAQDCLQGANDAVEYYNSVSGDIDQLKLSYEWNWLKEYYNRKYK